MALGSGNLAAGANEQQMSGTVVEYHPGSLTIENSKRNASSFMPSWGTSVIDRR